MTRANRILIIVIFSIAALLLAGYFWWQQKDVLPSPEPETAVVAASTAPTEIEEPPTLTPAPDAPPAILYRIETPPQREVMPVAKDHDHLLAQAIETLIGNDSWRTIFVPEQLIARIVATVDNLPREEASTKMWPVQPVGSWIKTIGSGEELRLDPANSERYAAYISLVQALSVDKLVGIYREFYPYFQKAYADLGYPDGYFNDRLVVVLDDLLATPEPTEAPRLVQKKIRYQFADPDLASRSAGQKIMLRIGIENARIVKVKLREIRKAVTTTSTAK